MITYWKNVVGFSQINNWEADCWIRVTNPTKKEMLDLERKFDVPLDFAHDAEDAEERPRLETEDGWLMAIIRVPIRYKDNDGDFVYTTRPLAIMTREDVFITVSHYKGEVLDDFINWSKRRKITNRKRFDLILSLILSSSVWYLKYLKQMNVMMKEAEELLDEKMDNDELQTMMGIGKFLVYFETSLRGNEVVMTRLKKALRDKPYDEDLLDDVEIEMLQAFDTAKIYGDILERQQSSYSSIIGNNMNITMKTLTVITILLMVPTLVAGFYGMNVPNGLETSVWGFIVTVLGSVILSAAVYMYLKIRKLL